MAVKKSILFLVCVCFFATKTLCQKQAVAMQKVNLVFDLDKNGIPEYAVFFNGKEVIKPSRLGFKILNETALDSNFKIIKTDSVAFNETWKPVWGEVSEIRNHYNFTIFLK